MKILTLHTQHNATCAYMDGDTIKCVVSEEKFSNIKNDASFPIQSIKYILKTFELKHFDRVIICAEQCEINEKGSTVISGQARKVGVLRQVSDSSVFLLYKLGFSKLYHAAQAFKFRRTKAARQKQIRQYVEGLNLFSFDDILFYDHHDCHAYAAYGALRANDTQSLVLTADGQGDFAAARVYKASPGGMECIANTYWTHSLGELYGKVTKILGMKQLEHEYKVMGLAPYAEDKDYYKATRQELFEGVLWVNDDLSFGSRYPMHLIDQILRKKIAYHRFDNIAAALQTFCEDLVIEWVKKATLKTGIRTLYTGGGFFMNVKVNKCLQDLEETDQTFFMPSSGDESLPIGACYKFYFDQMGEFAPPLENIYLGPSYSNEEIKAFIEHEELTKKFNITYVDDIEDHIADYLNQGHVVARFKGRTEWGARSLGNRAILARPDRMESFFRVNDQVKMRDFWMPFAPSMLRETYQDYTKAPKGQIAPYMITSFDSTVRGKRDFCAAMHNRDKTLRVQIIDKEFNPDYHDLVLKFYEKTGVGGVLNTSFNLHGYPLVCTPQQALFTINGCDLRYLALENYFLEKK